MVKASENLTERQQLIVNRLSRQKLRTAQAYRIRLELQDIYADYVAKDEARVIMKKFKMCMLLSRLAKMKKVTE